LKESFEPVSAAPLPSSHGAASSAGGAQSCTPIKLLASYSYSVSVIVISFNTRDLLRQCLQSLLAECARLPHNASAEVLVVDNASSDGSAEMVERRFSRSPIPLRLLRSGGNRGFGEGNNLALKAALGRYIVLLNSDAFVHPGGLALALEHMDANPAAGVGGARLVGGDGGEQPSARVFPSIARDALTLTGLAERFPRIFASFGRTGAGGERAVDWVTGAFMILRREALAKTGLFDPAFFLYCEEVDLCRRMKAAGFHVLYWPDVVVTHLGGESARQLGAQVSSEPEARAALWQMRSTLLYYRKHHGGQARLARWLSDGFYTLRRLRNLLSSSPARRARATEASLMLRLMRQAWQDTRGGRTSPPRPW
jgi:GT2 family glycosyltransferase